MMKITPKGAISRLGIRLRERRGKALSGQRPALTETDVSHISEFEKLIFETNSLLRKENGALSKGDVGRVAEYYSEKEGLMKALELRQPVIEPFLKEDIPEIHALRDLLKELGENLRMNGQLLSGMAEASRSIVSEVERIRKRQGLEGIYDKTGQLRQDLEFAGKKIEKNF